VEAVAADGADPAFGERVCLRRANRGADDLDALSGTVSNQGRFYSRVNAVVLLSAPAEVLLRRVETRTSNAYGKTTEERGLILSHFAEVEPLLRASCTHEIDATQPIHDVVAQLAAIGRGPLHS
jgi:shikimate kinase